MAKKWTVLVYMAAQDNHDLDAHAARDLREMERGVSGDCHVFVQIKRPWPQRPHRYEIKDGDSCLVNGIVAETNMGAGGTLESFLSWALQHDTERQYGTEQYFLVLWGHAFGLGFGRDHGDGLSLPELHDALKTFKSTRSGKRIELLGANACAMSYAEAAFELKDVADYLVASQIAVPFAGWPYESILKRLPTSADGAALGRIVVESYVKSFTSSPTDDQVAMTLLDLGKAGGLLGHLEGLTRAISDVLGHTRSVAQDRLAEIRTAFFATAAGDVRPLLDLYDLCEELKALSQDLKTLEPEFDPKAFDDLEAAADALRKFMTPATDQVGMSVIEPSEDLRAKSFVLYHKRHPELEGLHGVGVFAPFVTDDLQLRRLDLLDADDSNGKHRTAASRAVPRGRRAYHHLALPSKSGWDVLVYDDLRRELEHDVLTCIECTGAMTREEKAAVVQMLVGVNSTFERLDRTLMATGQSVTQILDGKVSGTGRQQEGQPAGNHESFPALTGFGDLHLFLDDDLEALFAKSATTTAAVLSSLVVTGGPESSPAYGPAVGIAAALRKMELAVARTEKAARRTLTHGTLGLGPGGGFREVKPGMGEVKPGMGEVKPGMGEVKPGMGEVKPGMGVLAMDGPTIATTVVELYVQVGQSLGQVEGAARDFERALAAAITGPSPGEVGVARKLADRLIKRRFRVLTEASSAARLTLRRVLAHPVCGFGPGPGPLDFDTRRDLARVAGLNTASLKLL